MVHLEVINQPPALKGKKLTHRNITCLAFDYRHSTRKLAIYETKEEWIDKTPSYTFCYVTKITYWDDTKEVNI